MASARSKFVSYKRCMFEHREQCDSAGLCWGKVALVCLSVCLYILHERDVMF